MRIICFEQDGQPRYGVRDPGGVREPLDQLIRDPAALFGWLRTAAPPIGPLHLPGTVKLLPPVPRPNKILCIGLNYRDHAAETGNPLPDYPTVFLRTAASLAAHETALLLPRESSKLDFEAELAVVVGTGGRRIAEGDALSHVGGYSCFNDATLRDYQTRSSQWGMGKNFDRTGGFGPDLVTPDELPPGARGLSIRTRLDGDIMQDGTTNDMVFGVAPLIALLSEAMTLEPGDVIITGTPAGVGVARRPRLYMRAGQTVEIEIEGIGTLRNIVEAD
ncbi:fumarylacetoacetate hydrolase family protein [Rhizosaccharibacter radicis]|uniref:Fumarylacetoacetate hydrolase family protein n=1 Tax=Rhizosaccharibacter radicis TaxID=2782605 RepID=A0ABT1VYD9_9PROT|nr:fumarylacetoacetate hydrolase family protein [Acetobacteraceae bacterium KSS12]